MNGCAGRVSGTGYIEKMPAKLSGQRDYPLLKYRREILLPGSRYSRDFGQWTNQKKVRVWQRLSQKIRKSSRN